MVADKYCKIITNKDGTPKKDQHGNVIKEGLKPSYDEVKSDPNWDFEKEMTAYCRADVELLGKSVLKFRKMFKEKLITKE